MAKRSVFTFTILRQYNDVRSYENVQHVCSGKSKTPGCEVLAFGETMQILQKRFSMEIALFCRQPPVKMLFPSAVDEFALSARRGGTNQ